MDTAHPQSHDKTHAGSTPLVASRLPTDFAVACALRPDLPVSDAEIDAILRLLGEDIVTDPTLN